LDLNVSDFDHLGCRLPHTCNFFAGHTGEPVLHQLSGKMERTCRPAVQSYAIGLIAGIENQT
jgi:hypothetical protein